MRSSKGMPAWHKNTDQAHCPASDAQLVAHAISLAFCEERRVPWILRSSSTRFASPQKRMKTG
jgi:hypothetical protein